MILLTTNLTNDFLLGLAGLIFILLAFLLDEFHPRINRNTITYNLLNIIGSALLIVYALSLNSWPFIILNSVWFIAASIKLINIVSLQKIKKIRR